LQRQQKFRPFPVRQLASGSIGWLSNLVNKSRLGGAEGDPFVGIELERYHRNPRPASRAPTCGFRPRCRSGTERRTHRRTHVRISGGGAIQATGRFAIEPATEMEFAHIHLAPPQAPPQSFSKSQRRLMVRTDLVDGGKCSGQILHGDLQARTRFSQHAVVGKNRPRPAERLPRSGRSSSLTPIRATPPAVAGRTSTAAAALKSVAEFESGFRGSLRPSRPCSAFAGGEIKWFL
jgi:hypothetical protein